MNIKKVLIANRGEIALRIIKTCKKLNIASVAVYSDADVHSMHVREADEAVAIGGTTPRESYLVIDKILEAAKQTGADAVHPGYGFLAENAEFADRVGAAGLNFIGPSPNAIATLGDKTAARALAEKAEVPFAPGSTGAVSSLEEVREIAANIGYPVLLKAAAGGGGKGMRVVNEEADLETGLASAQGEALTAFNDDRVFIEKFIVNPRHIEIQVVADKHGNVVVFPERECSVQRRHQKVVEESPSTAVSVELRAKMGEASRRLMRASNYHNAATVEFLLDVDGSFYFMEVNTRLQVEHPVTEMVTGIDLVEQQLLVADGQELKIRDADVEPKGHAIECRICVEDVYNDFFPATGTVSYLDLPEEDYIRNESALEAGYESSLHYDSMVAKLVVYGDDRKQCIDRTIDALDRYHLHGLKTTVPFCRFTLAHEAFRSGDYSTKFVGEHWHAEVMEQDAVAGSALAAKAKSVLDQNRKPVFAEPTKWNN